MPGAEVVVGVFERLGRRTHRLGIGDIAQLPVLLPSGAAVGAAPRALVHRLVGVGFEGLGRVERADALDPGVRQQRNRVVAEHAARLARSGPRGEPAALLLRGQQRLHVAALHGGVQDVRQRELRAERVPEAVVGVHVPCVHLAVVGAVIVGVALGVALVELAREEVGAEQARVEGADLLVRAALHVDAAQQGVPRRRAALLGRLERLVGAQLAFERYERLLGADVGRGGLGLHLRAGLEAHVGSVAVARALGLAREDLVLAVLPRAPLLEGLVELDDEVVAEGLRMVHEALVIDPARDAPLLGVDLHLALGEVAVEHQIGRTALPGIGEAQVHAARGGRHFGRDAVVERHLVVVGLADLVRMAELRGARLLVHDQLADLGHERIDGVVAHPRAALVGLLEAADLVHGVLVFPPFAVRAGLRRPGVHGVGHRRGGIGVAVAQFEPRIGSLERVHVLHVVALLRRGGRQGEECRGGRQGESLQRKPLPESAAFVQVFHVVCRYCWFYLSVGLSMPHCRFGSGPM